MGRPKHPGYDEEERKMNIVYATDDKYAIYTGISMVSLMENNRDLDNIIFYILDNGISDQSRAALSALSKRYHRTVRFIDISNYMEYIDFDLDTHGFNPIVVVRLFMSNYLPAEVKKVLYLDGDTLVTGKLSPLERIDMTEYDVAAVPELYMPPFKKRASIGFSRKQTYYNAGVLWINLERWRQTGIEKKFLAYYAKHSARLLFNDQDVINACCVDRIYKLEQWYNMSTNFCYFPRYFVKRIQPEYTFSPAKLYYQKMKRPVIIHYMGDERPWIHGSRNWCVPLFDIFAAKTPWKKVDRVYGQEWYMLFYHLLNMGTLLFPWGRIAFSNLIGINKYKWFGKA